MSKKLIIAVSVIWALVIAGGLGIGVVLLTAGDDEPDDAPDKGADASQDVEPGRSTLDDYYGQELTWSACGDDECASLDVPVSYQDLSLGTIKLAVERAGATGKRVGSLVVNPGGPGASGIDYDLRAAFDIVGFDPRGTGDSSPVDCLTDDELDAYIAADPDPDTPDEVEQGVENAEEFWSGCEAKSPAMGAHVSTVEAARDMDVLRAALGQDKLDYLGFSYGTRLGATYAEL